VARLVGEGVPGSLGPGGCLDPEGKEETLVRRRDEMYARAHEVPERSPAAEFVYVEPATMSRLIPTG
jgi:hypothetical protein